MAGESGLSSDHLDLGWNALRVRGTTHLNVVGMWREGSGSSGVYRNNRLKRCKREARLSRNSVAWAKALQWETGTDLTWGRERKPNWRVD